MPPKLSPRKGWKMSQHLNWQWTKPSSPRLDLLTARCSVSLAQGGVIKNLETTRCLSPSTHWLVFLYRNADCWQPSSPPTPFPLAAHLGKQWENPGPPSLSHDGEDHPITALIPKPRALWCAIFHWTWTFLIKESFWYSLYNTMWILSSFHSYCFLWVIDLDIHKFLGIAAQMRVPGIQQVK